MKKILFSLLPFLAASALAEPLAINLPTALRLADEKNTDLAIQVQKVAQAELDKSASWYQWVPTLRVGASYSWQEGALQNTDGTMIDGERNSRYAGFGSGTYGSGQPMRPGLTVGVDLSEAIFSPLAAKKRYQAAKLGENSSRLRVMLDVAAAYYELVQAYREEDIARLSAANAAQLAKQTADFASSGEGLQADAERVEVESLIQQQKVELAQERKKAAEIKLARLLKLEDDVQLIPADHMITPLPLIHHDKPLAELVRMATQVRPEVGENTATLAAEEARLKQEKYGIFLPKVEVGYSYGNFGGGSGTGNSYDDGRNDLYGMVYWQFDSLGLRNRNNIKKIRAQMNATKLIQEQTLVNVATEVRLAHSQYESSSRQLGLAKRAVDSARKSYELNSERIFENQGLPLEALQSIKALSEAESLYLTITAKYNLAQLKLVSATGMGIEGQNEE